MFPNCSRHACNDYPTCSGTQGFCNESLADVTTWPLCVNGLSKSVARTVATEDLSLHVHDLREGEHCAPRCPSFLRNLMFWELLRQCSALPRPGRSRHVLRPCILNGIHKCPGWQTVNSDEHGLVSWHHYLRTAEDAWLKHDRCGSVEQRRTTRHKYGSLAAAAVQAAIIRHARTVRIYIWHTLRVMIRQPSLRGCLILRR